MPRLLAPTLLTLCLASCGQPDQTPAPAAELSVRDTLIDCAGAIAAEGAVDPMADPSTGSAAENTYFTVLALMDKEPGLEGAAGREAARIASENWAAKSGEERAARAAHCTRRFAG